MSDKKVTMPYVRLGKSGLKVSRIILGCMSYGDKDWQGWVLGEEEGIKHIKTAFAAGINTFDTANAYSDGESERILGKAIKEIGAPRSSFVIFTKVFFPFFPKGFPKEGRTNPEAYGLVNAGGLSRKHIFESIKASLERLQLDYVDVLQCHRFDPDTPIEETMHALHDVVQAGYARYVGMSSCAASMFIYREEKREMIPLCKHLGVGTIPWSPLSRGLLSRPRNTNDATLRGRVDQWTSILQKDEDPNMAIIDRVEEIAKKKGVSMSQVSLAWVMAKEPVAAPIVGTTKLENIHTESVEVKLDEEEIKYLEEIYTSKPIIGH